jgi:hypothetical protein
MAHHRCGLNTLRVQDGLEILHSQVRPHLRDGSGRTPESAGIKGDDSIVVAEVGDLLIPGQGVPVGAVREHECRARAMDFIVD